MWLLSFFAFCLLTLLMPLAEILPFFRQCCEHMHDVHWRPQTLNELRFEWVRHSTCRECDMPIAMTWVKSDTPRVADALWALCTFCDAGNIRSV